jgi:hypothetical protein
MFEYNYGMIIDVYQSMSLTASVCNDFFITINKTGCGMGHDATGLTMYYDSDTEMTTGEIETIRQLIIYYPYPN